jgi:hypothetical protein
MHGKSFQERFRSKPQNEPPKAVARNTGWQRLCTVVPREWELRLLEAKRVSTYRLAIELLYLHWYGKGKPVAVTSRVASAANISASSKWNALEELERLGLIEVDRKPRRAPRAVVLHTQAPKS